MGLDFTSIPDREGAALYILHTGNSIELERFGRLEHEIEDQDTYQVELIDVRTPDGEGVRDFYDIATEQLPVAFVVLDDDSIIRRWDGAPFQPIRVRFCTICVKRVHSERTFYMQG